jgi:glycosyltransferase involved in cell wall biosynthesis
MSKKNVYVIIDFISKHKHFHNPVIIERYSQIIRNTECKLIIILPAHADRLAFNHTEGEKLYMLHSLHNGPNFGDNPPLYVFFKISEFLISKSILGSRFKLLLRKVLIRKVYKFIKSLSLSNLGEINILFPSPDPLSVELAKKLSESKIKTVINFLFRIIGNESRGALASNFELDTINQIAKIHKNKVKIGYETSGYLNYLLKKHFDKNVTFWSPWPEFEVRQITKSSRYILNIGFMGAAKSRKGFDLIPNILNEIQKNNIDFKAYIQRATYPWAEYELTLKKLDSFFSKHCVLLPNSLELNELQSYINNLDVIILPYDPKSYSINASGIVYHACDARVPILTFEGVGFASELEKYNLGFLFRDIKEIPDLLYSVEQKKDYGFSKYNEDRNRFTLKFLFD